MNDADADVVPLDEQDRTPRKAYRQKIWHQLLYEGDPCEGAHVQFGLGTVLALQAAAALALSLLLVLDLVGVFVLFVGTVLVMFWPIEPPAARARRVFADLLAGALMPVLCLIFDPGILRDNGTIYIPLNWGLLRNSDASAYLATAIFVQIGFLLLWQLLPRTWPAVSALFAGLLSVGFVLAASIGIYILPITLVGLLLLAGLLGAMPFLTAIVYLRNVISAWRSGFGAAAGPLSIPLFLLGAITAMGFPLVLSLAYGQQINDFFNAFPNYGMRWL